MAETFGFTLQGFKEPVYTQEDIDNMMQEQPCVYYGSGMPLDTQGKIGDIYIKLEEEGN